MIDKDEIKLALLIDSYKLPRKDELWKESEKQARIKIKDFEKMSLVREEIHKDAPTKGIISIFRYYRKGV
jgi:hypothetical protein